MAPSINYMYVNTVRHPLSREILFCFGYEVPVTNWDAHELQYQPTGQWNMSKFLDKISRLSG